MYHQLASRLGETQHMTISHNGEMKGYYINGFKVFFGLVFNTGDADDGRYYFTHYFVKE